MCSLKYWQTVFKNHSKDKTGILKAERLKDALLEVGFQVNTDVLSILILRYMRKDGTLRFGDFVSAILHLSIAFNLFESKDPLLNGNIKLNLADWLKSAFVCWRETYFAQFDWKKRLVNYYLFVTSSTVNCCFIFVTISIRF